VEREWAGRPFGKEKKTGTSRLFGGRRESEAQRDASPKDDQGGRRDGRSKQRIEEAALQELMDEGDVASVLYLKNIVDRASWFFCNQYIIPVA